LTAEPVWATFIGHLVLQMSRDLLT